jgi:hypothetical protein
MNDLREQARKLIASHLEAPRDRHPDDPYAQLDAALAASLRGEPSAAGTLLRVFTEPFAVSNSLHEQGLAALGLALLGVREAIPHIGRAQLINLNRLALPLALSLLEKVEESLREDEG